MRLDERVLQGTPDRSPRLALFAGPGADGATGVEVLVYTEFGYEVAPWPAPLTPHGGGPVSTASLMGVLASGNGRATLGQALIQAADLGAARAFLEVRAVGGQELVAASPWLELTWGPELLARAFP